MKHIPYIKSVMTPFPYYVESTASILEAKKMMVEHRIHHLPVMEKKQLIGEISDRDVRLATDPNVVSLPENEMVVKDLCILNAYIVDLKAPLDTVLIHMSAHHLGSALVVKNGQLVGVFTMNDACRLYGEYLRDTFHPSDGNDAA